MALHVFVIKETELEDRQDLRAEIGKFPNSTNERKNMSTKTLRKRIALVAVATLGAGVLSVAPAHAVDGDIAVTALDYAATTGTIGSAVATDNAQAWTVATTGKVRITFDAAAGAYVQLSGPCYFVASTLGSGNTLTAGNTRVTTPSTTDAVVDIIPTAAGTCIASAYASASAATTSDKLTLTIVASSTIGTLSTSNSFARLETASEVSTGAEVTNGADVSGASRVANGGQGYIGFTLHDSNDQPMPATTVVGCSATGGAVCSFTSATFLGTSSAANYDGDSYDTIYVAQGTANAAISTVVTITVNGAVWLTKSFTLLGDIASIELSAGDDGVYGQISLTQTEGINLKVKDSLGRLLTSVATDVSAASYNASVTGVGTATTGSSTSLGTQVSFSCSSTRGSSEITVSKTNTALAKITSNALKVHCVGAADSYSAAFDKAVYAPGDLATLTITAKDSAGNPASDISTIGAAAAIAGSNMTPVTAPVSTDTFTAGVKKYTYIVGSTTGSYQMSVSLTDIDDAVTVPYTIKSSSTAVTNEDVLKAIVSLIASINKQIAALQKALLRR
jgi:hypothetical protein